MVESVLPDLSRLASKAFFAGGKWYVKRRYGYLLRKRNFVLVGVGAVAVVVAAPQLSKRLSG